MFWDKRHKVHPLDVITNNYRKKIQIIIGADILRFHYAHLMDNYHQSSQLRFIFK